MEILEKSLDNFRAGIRACVRGFWTQDLSISEFFEEMRTTIERELWIAYYEGVESCGMEREDVEPAEMQQAKAEIEYQLDFIMPFAMDIQDRNRAAGGELQPLLDRAEMWINRYEGIKSLAQTHVCGDTKLEWIYGDTDHCDTCERLNGTVKRASIWNASGIMPRNGPNERLACSGFRCQCYLEPTKKPCTPGPIPRAP
jgi:hypothetical protein